MQGSLPAEEYSQMSSATETMLLRLLSMYKILDGTATTPFTSHTEALKACDDIIKAQRRQSTKLPPMATAAGAAAGGGGEGSLIIQQNLNLQSGGLPAGTTGVGVTSGGGDLSYLARPVYNARKRSRQEPRLASDQQQQQPGVDGTNAVGGNDGELTGGDGSMSHPAAGTSVRVIGEQTGTATGTNNTVLENGDDDGNEEEEDVDIINMVEEESGMEVEREEGGS